MPARFYAESYSPWCERARWALQHHGIPFREIEQKPLLAEVTLRLLLGTLERVTVPLFMDGNTHLVSSDAIARHGDLVGTGKPLFPVGHEAEIASWMNTSELVMVNGRAQLLPRIAASRDARREGAPMAWMTTIGVRHLMRKYAVRAADGPIHDAESRRALDRVRLALGQRDHLVGESLTYADITIAAALQFVRPVDDRWIELRPATRIAWTNEPLAKAYADVLDWRDRLYAKCRRT
ncbi:MAG: glutathione S-transferase family protein [Kofleriaceae bacterium]